MQNVHRSPLHTPHPSTRLCTAHYNPCFRSRYARFAAALRQVVVSFYVADSPERAIVKWCNDQVRRSKGGNTQAIKQKDFCRDRVRKRGIAGLGDVGADDRTPPAIPPPCPPQGYSGLVQEMTEPVHTLVHYPERDQLLVVSCFDSLRVSPGRYECARSCAVVSCRRRLLHDPERGQLLC
jgi:hypothetical protein